MPDPSEERADEGVRAERWLFSAALVVFAFLYGWGAGAFGWPPGPLVASGVSQARAAIRPSFLSPRVHDRTGVRSPRPEAVQPGLTLVATEWRQDLGWVAGARLLDRDGEVLHEWRLPPREIFSDAGALWNGYVHGTHLFDDGDLIVNIEGVGTTRVDACGTVRWTLARGNHHSVALDDRGNIWTPSREELRTGSGPDSVAAATGLPLPLVDNRILEISPDGQTLREFSLLQVLYENGLARHVIRAREAGPDVLHVNDIEPLGAALAMEYPDFAPGDLLVSLRNANLVLVVDPKGHRVKWHATGPFVHQHDPDFIGGGWIGVFDNNLRTLASGAAASGSRIVAVTPGSDSVRVLFPTPHSEPFFTEEMGKWQLLDNGNLLLTESQAGRVVEVDPTGRTVWEWIEEPANDAWVPEVSEGTRYQLTPEAVASWPCSRVSNGGHGE